MSYGTGSGAPLFSDLTIAFLEDTNQYIVNHSASRDVIGRDRPTMIGRINACLVPHGDRTWLSLQASPAPFLPPPLLTTSQTSSRESTPA